ncbi:protein unc-50 homolog isoform X2 [Nematostella vectensis]|uniref:protein unc-50 homolog isoform X2 n=1 Tax=Nematostella vectensis TaxID=45351 RepID=UPI0013903A8A|nr:protein unc-50 homolog isoform X2 [Nematostella vectensis]
MLPLSTNSSYSTAKSQLFRTMSTSRRWKYLKRILKFRHMDFEFALWQMLYLCVSPQKVYRNFHYHKQTKDQWARDDPAFLVLLSFWLCVSSIGFAIVLKLHFLGFIKFLLWVVFIDCIGCGLCIATVLWIVTNRYLRIPSTYNREQGVEWGYAFDVHLNAFFPLLIILHVVQLFFIIDHPWFISRFIGNTLWLIALVYYVYITFLGYSALPFLKNTVTLLYPPVLIVGVVYVVSLAIGWNISQSTMFFYRYRVL